MMGSVCEESVHPWGILRLMTKWILYQLLVTQGVRSGYLASFISTQSTRFQLAHISAILGRSRGDLVRHLYNIPQFTFRFKLLTYSLNSPEFRSRQAGERQSTENIPVDWI